MATVKNLTVVQDYFDGSVADAFTKLGYPARWKKGERRDLPQEIVKRIVESGGLITIAEPTAKESAFVQGAEPTHTEPKFGKVRTRVVFPEGFRDGAIAADCAAIGHPDTFGVGEIVDLPPALIEKIKRSGGFVSTDPDAMLQFENQQGKHQLKIEQWHAARKAEAERMQARQATEGHNKSVLAEIEELSERVITATGKQKEALWKRIDELHKSLR